MFTVTYDIVTPESAENGDYAESGFVIPGHWNISVEDALDGNDVTMSLREAISLTGEHLIDVGSWFEGSTDTDYSTGAETRYSLHPPRNITPASYARLKRLLKA